MAVDLSPSEVLIALADGPLTASEIAGSRNAKVLARLRATLVALAKQGRVQQVQIGLGRRWALAGWRETPAMLALRMQRECVPDGDTGCLLWRGYCSEYGVPYAKVAGKQTSLRVQVFSALTGKRVSRRHYLVMTCGNAACLNTGHMRRVLRSEVSRGKPKALQHRLKTAQAARRRANAIGGELACLIRSSPLSDAELARQLGRPPATINSVRRGRTYKAYVTPFWPMGSV